MVRTEVDPSTWRRFMKRWNAHAGPPSPPDIPLFGFAGGPWTVSTYMIQGQGGDKDLARLHRLSNGRRTWTPL